MSGFLRQSTAAQSRLIGPFLTDVSPYIDAATGLTIANTDIKLRANGTTLANKNSGGATHQVNGMYSVTWDATDTANVGELSFSVKIAGALAWAGSYVVLEEAVYDALFAAGAAGFGTAQTGDSFARLGAPAGASVSADVAAVKTKTDALPADPADQSLVIAATDALATLIGQRATPAQVNAEMVDVMATDTHAQPGQEAPAATTSYGLMLRYLYKVWRNKKTQTATTRSVFADDGTTVDHKATDADDGTTYTKGELGTGP